MYDFYKNFTEKFSIKKMKGSWWYVCDKWIESERSWGIDDVLIVLIGKLDVLKNTICK